MVSNDGPMATVRPGWLCPSASATVGESISWRFEGGREGCGETTAAVGVSGALLGCTLDETWPGVGVDGEGVVEVEEASRISRAAPDGRDLALCKKTVFFNHVKIVFFNHFFFHLHCFSELFFSVFCKYEKQSKRWQKGIVFFSLKKLKISVTDYH